jgi:hypothetical protein
MEKRTIRFSPLLNTLYHILLNELKEDNNSATKGMGNSQRMERDLVYWPQKEDSKEGKMV